MALDPESGRPTKKFKHQSYQASLKTVHLPSAASQSKLDDELPDSESHFQHALEYWRQINLSPVFVRFAAQVTPLSSSVSLLLHNSSEIAQLWINAVNEADYDGLKALFDILQKLVYDLRTTLQPHYLELLNSLLSTLSRSLTAETLTLLLSTLSLFFKHLLNSKAKRILPETWDAIMAIVQKCNPEVQRALAEVWSTVLRRLKEDVRISAVMLVLQVPVVNIDFGTWVFVHIFKSVTSTLHTCTTILFGEILDSHVLPNDAPHSEVILRRVITALVHHCDKAEHFTPLSDTLINRFCSNPSTHTMALLSTAVSVRKGSRITQNQISKVLTLLTQLIIGNVETADHITLGAACLIAGEMHIWMGPGRKFVEASWQNPSLGIKLAGVLSSLDWPGWRLIQLPFVLKHTVSCLETYPQLTFALLSSLAEAGRLDDADEAWLQHISKIIQKILERWTLGFSSLQELVHMISFCRVAPSISPSLIPVASVALQSNPSANIALSEDLCAQVFGTAAKALAQDPEAASRIDILSWITSAIKRWPQSSVVLEGVVALAKCGSFHATVPITELYEPLQRSILNYRRSIRLNSLRLLSSNIVESGQYDSVLQECLLGEEATLDVQGVRVRVLRMANTLRVVKTADKFEAVLALRWLIAQLQVNLRPLWVPAIKAISALSGQFPEVVWSLIFSELTELVQGEIKSQPYASQSINDTSAENEHSWRDPSANKLRLATDLWFQKESIQTEIIKVEQDRLDLCNYENQLLSALEEVPALTERHNADLIRLFLLFGSPDLPNKPPRPRLLHWLTLFSKLDNPKTFHQTLTLRKLHSTLLSHPDRSLRTVALTCLLKYKELSLVSYETHLRGLLDKTKWRDEITSFDLTTVKEGDRSKVMDVVIRLLYGLILDRHGKAKDKTKRAGILGALQACQGDELRLLVDLMLEPFNLSSSSTEIPDNVTWLDKHQAGFLSLLGDVMKRLALRLVPYWPSLFLVAAKCAAISQRKLMCIEEKTKEILNGEQSEEELEAAENDAVEVATFNPRATRAIRQIGIKRLTDFFRDHTTFSFEPYMSFVFAKIVSPRLAALDRENTQAPSALLDLFYSWSLHKESVHLLVDYDERVLPRIYMCLQATNVKPSVISRIFDIIDRVLALANEHAKIAQCVLRPHMQVLLDALMVDLSRSNTPGLLQRQVNILSQISGFASDASQAKQLLQHFAPLLKFPLKVISEKIKVHLLKITASVITVIPEFDDPASQLYVQTYDVIARLLQLLHSKAARFAILDVFEQFYQVDHSMKRIFDLLCSLNAFSPKRLDEPDFERRLQAFNFLNETLYLKLSLREWIPILYNMLQFIQDPEELVIRTNAAYSMRRFIDVLTAKEDPELVNVFIRMLFPALKRGLLCQTELVRNEVLGVLAYGIEKCNKIDALSELRPLLADGDSEANFFNNVHHVQIHRRIRSLRRLSDYTATGNVRSATIFEVFLPLIRHNIINALSMDHNLVDMAVTTTGHLARHLTWSAYNAIVKDYMSLVKSKTPSERACVRALVAILENFHFSMDNIVIDSGSQSVKDIEDSENAIEETSDSLENPTKTGVTRRIADAVNFQLLPTLLKHFEAREENEDSLRVPICAGIAQVACHLPEIYKHTQISRLVTILSQIFRSRSQDTRILARETLCKVAVIIGPSYLPNIVTELRGALIRGSHLHILAVVVYALIDHVTSKKITTSFNNLDSCAADVAHVSAEVVFGQSGNDVRSEGFTTTIAEVKGSSSKGLGCFAILARHVTPSHISVILQPIKTIMQETAAAKTMNLVEDVLRRISLGLNANECLSELDYLSLCHSLIQQNSRFLKDAPRIQPGKEKGRKDFIVQLKRQNNHEGNQFTHNSFRFVVFGLELFNTAFRRGRFDLKNSDILSRLEAMVPIIGNTLFSQEGVVVIQGLKATGLVVKCSLKSLEDALPVFVKQIMHIIRQAGNTESDVVQAAFRTLVVILRDCQSFQIKDSDLSYLLNIVAVDIEEPERQAPTFAMLRAVISRKLVVVEVYDMMDKVSQIMVTSQSRQVQEVCRSVLLQFLLDYPQGKGRLKKQMTFLVKNLSYTFESGRQSVMELLNAIFLKFDLGLLNEYADLYFVGLVMVLANDDSSKCREMAAELLKVLLQQADAENRKKLLSHLHIWSSEKTQLPLARVSAQICGLVVDALQSDLGSYSSVILLDMNLSIIQSAQDFQKLESDSNQSSSMDIDIEWQIPYHTMTALSKLIRHHPDLCNEHDKIAWKAISQHLLFPHAWVRNISARLIGILFSITPRRSNYKLEDNSLLSLAGLIDIAHSSCLQLKTEALDASLSLQVVKNLLYVGKTFVSVSSGQSVGDSDDNDIGSVESDVSDKMQNILKSPVSWLFSKLSYQTRSAWLARRNRMINGANWSEQPMAVIRWFAAMATYMDSVVLEKYLVHILNPIYRIIDDDTIHDKQMDSLKLAAQELVELTQNKVGTTKFGEIYNTIRQRILSARTRRKVEKAISATKNPQAAALHKIHRNRMKKISRNRIDRAFAKRKDRINRSKATN